MLNSPIKEKMTFNKNKDQTTIREIKQKISAMKNSQFRTTNFSLIEFIVDNDFKPLIIEEITKKLIKDYKSNPKKYILSSDKGSFKSESTFKKSIIMSISRNKAFIKGPGNGQLSLNLNKTLQYLNTMYKQYINNSTQIKTPYKLFSHKSKNKIKRNTDFSPINKEENISTGENEMEVEQEIEIPKAKSQNLDLHNKNTNFTFGKLYSSESHKNEKEEIINISNNTQNTFAHMFNKEILKVKKDIPDIFLRKLYQDIFISNINNDYLRNIVDSTNKMFLNIKSQKMNDQIKREIEKINAVFH